MLVCWSVAATSSRTSLPMPENAGCSRPLQNRVTPFGEIVSAPWRGALMGNRGCLHDGDGHLGVRRWRHQHWVCCLTAFRGRVRDPMPAGRWTALFFWDEAVALAAGHRPCGQCRYVDYQRFKSAWQDAGLPGSRPAICLTAPS